MAELPLKEWTWLVSLARVTHLLSRLSLQVTNLGLLDHIPEQVLPHLQAARVLAEAHDRELRWEVNRLERALRGIETPIVLLKGAAYALAGFPTAEGRLYGDLDFLVPKEKLRLVEEALKEHGWVVREESEFREQYTRRWLHELPALVHNQRHTQLDVHHNILPHTDHLRVDAGKLLESALPLRDNPRFSVLAPTDMVLHGAAHMFRSGDFVSGLRNLVDLDDLLQQFGREESFWSDLLGRATALGLRLPCYWGLRYAERFLETPIPHDTKKAIRGWKPFWPPRFAMDWLVERALLPRHIDRTDRTRDLAMLLLSRYPLSLFRRTIVPKLEWLIMRSELK
ncbi:MAG TPA: nucleotidyltransferase family protein [Methylomirabilota bacterium]|nr:nucleotidyltransferase family protein [Methylomirabilota bacterium]